MASLIIIAVCVVIVTAIVAYERGFGNGFKEARRIFNQVFDNSLLRLNSQNSMTWDYSKTEQTDTDEQE